MNKGNSNKVNQVPQIKPFERILSLFLNITFNLLILFAALSIKYLPFEQWLLPFAILSLFQLIINLISVYKLEGNFVTLSSLFVIFFYITHLSFLVIFGFRINVELPWDPLLSLSKVAFKEACYYGVLCHSCITFGMCTVLYRRKNYNVNLIIDSQKEEEKQLYLSRIIGFILIIMGLIPMLYLDISRILLYINGNYLDTYTIGASGFIVTISRFTEIGVIMLLIGIHKNKKKAYITLLIIVIYETIIMFTGNRGRPIMFLTIVFYIYINFIKKIGFKQFLNIILGVYILGFVLTFVGQIRMLQLNTESIFLALKNSLINFSFYQVLAEFGVTIISLGLSLEYFSFIESFSYGSNYVASLLTIFPNINDFLDPIVEKSIFVYSLPSHAFLGGSIIGELYYNFGNFSYIFAIIIGIFVGFISKKVKENILRKKYIVLSIYLILFPNILWWIRSYFIDMVREFVWTTLLILFLYKYFDGRFKMKTKGGFNEI